MQTLLVVGGESLAGSNLALTLCSDFAVMVLGETGQQVGSTPTIDCDLGDAGEVLQQVRSLRPDWIVHCGPFSHSAWEPDTPVAPAAVEEALNIARAAEGIGCYLAVVSTDEVCDGPLVFHEEEQVPSCSGLKAQAASGMEDAVRGICRRSLIARTHTYGWSLGVQPAGMAEQIVDAMEAERPLSLEADRYATPLLATDLAKTLADAYRKNLTGLYHVSGSERTSPYGFGLALSDVFSLSPSCLKAVWGEARTEQGQRAHETSLATHRIRNALGRSMPMLYDGLQRFREQKDNGFRDELAGGATKPARLENVA